MNKLNKFFMLLIICLSASLLAKAAKSSGEIRFVQQSDGTTLSYRVCGDEYFHWSQTTDGVLIIWENNSFYVGTVTGAGTLKSSGIIAHNSDKRTDAENAAIATQDNDRKLFFSFTAQTVAGAKNGGLSNNSLTYTSSTICPHKGTITIPVIMVRYSDMPFMCGATYNGTGAVEETLPTDEQIRSTFNDYFNKDADFELGKSSVAKYFKDASEGNFNMVFELYGPYTLSNTHNYYGHKSSTSSSIYADALTISDADIDFTNAKYDSNGDGNIDMVCVLHAGAGANLTVSLSTGDPNDHWPSCFFGTYYGKQDGKKIPVIGAFPELKTYPTTAGKTYEMAGIGVTCHELSHGLGMPDLYDTNTSAVRANYNNNGPEFWDLMDGGENIGNALYPCQYMAWEKDYFDWNKAVQLTKPSTVTLTPLNENGTSYKVVNPDDATEYYIIEAAQTKEWNYGLFYYLQKYGKCTSPGGLLVEHVSKTALTYMTPNDTYNNGYQPSLTLIPADEVILSQSSVNGTTVTAYNFYESLSGDVYPGTQNVNAIAKYKNYTGNDMESQYPITDITQNSDGSISFKFMGGSPSVALNSGSYATFSCATDVVIKTDGVKAYKASVDGDAITLTALEGYIPAGTGVLLYGEGIESGTTVNFELPNASVSAADVTGNAFLPTTTATTDITDKPAGTVWALGNDDDFLKYTGTAFIANRAYLVHELGSSAKALRFVFDGEDVATSVSEVSSDTTVDNKPCYNIAGQRVNANAKGIVITNGRKYFNK